MKIVTNIRFYTVAGIAQYLSSLVQYNEQKPKAHIFGIDIMRPHERQDVPVFDPAAAKHFTLIAEVVPHPPLKELLGNCASLEDLRRAFEPVIDAYYQQLRKIKPDCIVINGTYALPWSLLQAARRWGRADIVIHYHGILTKETAHWDDLFARQLMTQMEKEFDMPDALYIFPSNLARQTVEEEVFKHSIINAITLPNPVSDHFFDAPARPRRASLSLGMVARWNKIKNVDFFIALARYAKRYDKKCSFPIVTNIPSQQKKSIPAIDLLEVKKPIPNQRLPRFYRELGALLLPSQFETYGNVAQEALAAGTPVLVGMTAGVAETLILLGLGEWIHDFSSAAHAFETAAHIASISVPEQARSVLRLSFSVSSIFSAYFRILKDWC